jgi:hypothetical protein
MDGQNLNLKTNNHLIWIGQKVKYNEISIDMTLFDLKLNEICEI